MHCVQPRGHIARRAPGSVDGELLRAWTLLLTDALSRTRAICSTFQPPANLLRLLAFGGGWDCTAGPPERAASSSNGQSGQQHEAYRTASSSRSDDSDPQGLLAAARLHLYTDRPIGVSFGLPAGPCPQHSLLSHTPTPLALHYCPTAPRSTYAGASDMTGRRREGVASGQTLLVLLQAHTHKRTGFTEAERFRSALYTHTSVQIYF